MSERERAREFPSLRRALLSWFAGSGVVLVLVYTLLLGFYLDLGVAMLSKSILERTAANYAEELAADPTAPLPTGQNLHSYRQIEDIPTAVRERLSPEAYRHREMRQFVGLDESDDPKKASPLSCEGGPCAMLVFFSYQLDDRTWLYLTQGLVATEVEDLEYDFFTETVALVIGLVFALMLLGLAIVLSRRIGKPVWRLAHWADNLRLDALDEAPDFRFRELNLVATRLRSAFHRIAKGLENEQQFLQYASHELRTPLSVISGNVELLDKLTERRHRCDAEREALDRLNSAVSNMRQLIETLLWLSRTSDTSEEPPMVEPVELHALVQSLVEENRYLLDSKPINIVVTGDTPRIHVPLAPCGIVLANLIRNAFQYTDSGRVSINIGHDHITIGNESKDEVEENSPTGDADYGFGIGLKLVGQLCGRFGWGYECSSHGDRHSATVQFHMSDAEPVNDDETTTATRQGPKRPQVRSDPPFRPSDSL